MHHGIASRHPCPQRLRLRQVAQMRLAPNSFQIFELARPAHQHAQGRSLRRKCASHMMTDEARGACKEDFHKRAELAMN